MRNSLWLSRLLVSGMVLSILLGACRGGDQKEDKDKETDEESSKKEKDDDESGGGLLGGGGALAMGSMLAQAAQPGLYDGPRESADFDADEAHYVILELGGNIVELKSVSLFGGVSGNEMSEIERRLRDFAEHAHVKGLILRVEDLSIGMAGAESLRRRLIDFKEGGKRSLHCHAESISNVGYYVLTACDTIGLAPTGQVVISGVAAMPMHLKGLLDKLAVKADFLHVGDYKGAAEPLTLDQPSRQMTETLGSILDQSYATLVDGISSGRGIDKAAVPALIDKAMFNGKEAVVAKLVDQESIFEAFRDDVVGEAEWRITRLGADGEPGFGKIMELIGLSKRSRPSADHVAVVYAVGNIIDGKGEGLIGSRSEVASRTLSETLRVLAAEKTVKAVVLRVDSPGGSALASEIIWHAVQELKAVKPVIVSMGSVAASGGYYISCGANRIFAEETTLTGSIGVVGGKLAIEGALGKLGIKTFPMGRGKRALMWNSLGPWSNDERAAVQTMMEDIYKVFVGRVAEGRGKSYDEIHKIAQGRVWTGKAALANGLVDEIGGLDAALAHARELSKVDVAAPLEVYPPEPTLMDFMNSFTSGVGAFGAQALLADIDSMLGHQAATVVSQTLDQLVTFESDPIQTTLILPVLWGDAL